MGIACFLIATAGMIGWDSYLALKDIMMNQVVNDYANGTNMLAYLVLIDDHHDHIVEWTGCIIVLNCCKRIAV